MLTFAHSGTRYLAILLWILMMTAGYASHAQYYSTGQEAASIRWRQIHTNSIRIIFPDYYEERARWLASYLDTVADYGGRSLNYRPKKVPLIMHTRSARSNAVVAWAPKRMEFYTMPSQDMYAQPWLEQLSLHEYRHVVQIEKLNQGPTKVLSWLLGQQGTAAVLGLYVPPWFLEGDAVATETALGNSGRGRVPDFEMELRAQILEKGVYSYDKAVLGSYRDHIPDQYVLGYHLVAEGRRQHGSVLWEHTLDRVAGRPYMITPFQKGIRDISGKRKVPFYEYCLWSLGMRWEKQDEKVQTSRHGPVSPSARHYTNYRNPVLLDDGSILSLRQGIDDISRIVKIDEKGQEEVFFTPGYISGQRFTHAGNRICWTESRPHPRWTHTNYTDIILLDTESRKSLRLQYNRKLLAPALSADAGRIVVVAADSLDRYLLLTINTEDGKISGQVPLPGNAYPQHPVWMNDTAVLAVLVSGKGKSIISINPQNGRHEVLIPWAYHELSRPVYHFPYVYFVASWSGISNIYRYHMESGDIQKVTGSRFGCTDPCLSPDGRQLLYADYGSGGYRLLKNDDPEGMPLAGVTDNSIGLHRAISRQENRVPQGSSVPAAVQPSKRYSKVAGLFNIHSWAPLDVNANNYTIHPGVSLMSQNLLSSSFLTAGYTYNVNEELGKVYAGYTYAGWFPMIDLSVEHGLRRDVVFIPDRTPLKWRETSLRTGLRLPLNFSRGKYFSGLQSYAYADQIYRQILSPDTLNFREPDVFSLRYGLMYYRQIRSGMRDIYPRWGQSLGLYYRHIPFDGNGQDYIGAMVLNLYFPGIIRHHGINVYAGYQRREATDYKFPDLLPYPRGMNDLQHEELLSFRGTYALPIAYPDWSIGPLIYLKRIRAMLFYDYSIGSDQDVQQYYSSAGADLLFETHVLRFFAPIEMGVRGIYLPNDGELDWQFLISVGFESFYVGNRALGGTY